MADFVAKIDALLQDDMSQVQHDQVQRRKALRLARLLCTQLESPMDHILRMSWQEPQYKAALKICIDLKVFDIIGKASADFVSVADIATATGAEPALLHRVLRHLASMAALRERDPDCYGPTPLTEALRRPEIASGVEYWFDIAAPTFLSLPKFLAETGYKDPVSVESCNWQMAKNTKLNLFDYLCQHPLEMANFAQHMSGYTSDRGSWLDLYPADRLLNGARVDSPILVDVGGSLGHDAKKFKQKYPQATGEVVVQDLPSVVAQAKPDASVQIMAHDFWTEQPVKGTYHKVCSTPVDVAICLRSFMLTAFPMARCSCLLPTLGTP